MRTFKIFKVFCRLKWEEFKNAIECLCELTEEYKDGLIALCFSVYMIFPFAIDVVMSIQSGRYLKPVAWGYWLLLHALSFVVIVLKRFLHSNWKQATEEVDAKDKV